MPRIPTTISQGPMGRALTGASSQARGPSLTREQFSNRQQNATQEAARAANAPANACPFIDGNMLTGVTFTNTVTTTLKHQLGRKFRGFFLLYQRTPAGAGTAAQCYCQPNTDSRLDASQIQLTAQGTFTADVWVY